MVELYSTDASAGPGIELRGMSEEDLDVGSKLACCGRRRFLESRSFSDNSQAFVNTTLPDMKLLRACCVEATLYTGDLATCHCGVCHFVLPIPQRFVEGWSRLV
jgi:hypothetical protein